MKKTLSLVDITSLWRQIRKKPNVIGYSSTIQPRIRKGRVVKREKVFRVYVSEKVPETLLKKEDVVPRELRDSNGVAIPTDVVEIGKIRALDLDRTARHRPIFPGISIGHYLVTAGTLGLIVRRPYDLTSTYILSNNHVLANENKGKKGDPILQPGCVPPGTIVFANPKPKVIEEIRSGDHVLGLSGRPQKVCKVYRFRFTGSLIEIKPSRAFPFATTPDHLILVLRLRQGYRNGWEKRKALRKAEVKWIPASEVKKTDFLLVPRFRFVRSPSKAEGHPPRLVIVKRKFKCLSCGYEFVGVKKRVKSRQCGKCKSKRVVEMGVDYKITKTSSLEFAYVLGLFMADGYAHLGKSSYLRFSLGAYEEEKVTKLCNSLSKLGVPFRLNKYLNVIRVQVNLKKLAEWFRKYCYRGKEKVIPQFVFTRTFSYLRKFIEGYHDGDSKWVKSGMAIGTASPTLARQLYMILNALGWLPSISIRKGGVCVKSDGRTIEENDFYVLQFYPHSKRYRHWFPLFKLREPVFVAGKRKVFLYDWYAVAIKSINKKEYDGPVFDITTQDHSFLTPAIIHNSYDGGRLNDKVAELSEYVPIHFTSYNCKYRNFLYSIAKLLHLKKERANLVDAAIAKVTTDYKIEIAEIGVPMGIGKVEVGSTVQKSGRTTGWTVGPVVDTDWCGYVEYSRGIAFFEDQILVGKEGWSAGGDSGSSVLDMKKRVVGLLFAGSRTHTIVNKIEHCLRSLNIKVMER